MDYQLLIETSSRRVSVGLVAGDSLLEISPDDTPRHARTLASLVQTIIHQAGISPRAVSRVIVSQGPGSYTGLRVGLASAKSLAYATGCALVAVPTFHAIAESLPAEWTRAGIIADALQGLAYVQRFEKRIGWSAVDELSIVRIAEWSPHGPIAGPGVRLVAPGESYEMETPRLTGLLRASSSRCPVSPAELFALEPLYLRGSTAEELRKSQSDKAESASARVS